MCVWRRLGVRHKRLGVVKGVRRRASPRRLKNIEQEYRSYRQKPKLWLQIQQTPLLEHCVSIAVEELNAQ